MDAPSESSDPSHSPASDHGDGIPPDHLVCAYSPRWLSGPTPYEGLVATVAITAEESKPTDR
jgi:hypothetical protein